MGPAKKEWFPKTCDISRKSCTNKLKFPNIVASELFTRDLPLHPACVALRRRVPEHARVPRKIQSPLTALAQKQSRSMPDRNNHVVLPLCFTPSNRGSGCLHGGYEGVYEEIGQGAQCPSSEFPNVTVGINNNYYWRIHLSNGNPPINE